MLQKIIRVGNSLAITIPKDFARQINLRAGEMIAVETDISSKTLLVKPKKEAYKTSLTPEFFDWLSRISTKYEKAIEELAKR